MCTLKTKHAELPRENARARVQAGSHVYGVQIRSSTRRQELAPTARPSALLVRRPTIRARIQGEGDPLPDGWSHRRRRDHRPDGFMQITDRSKEVIQSGGGGSLDRLENIASAPPRSPGRVIACAPKWTSAAGVAVKKAGARSRAATARVLQGQGRQVACRRRRFVDQLPTPRPGSS